MKLRTLAFSSVMPLCAAMGITVHIFAKNLQAIRSPQIDPTAQVKIIDRYGKLPLSFEANYRQTSVVRELINKLDSAPD